MKERDETMRLIRRAEIAGYRALVITVDAPVIGNRETDQKDELFFPNGITMPNVSHILEKKYADIDHVSALTQYLSLGLAESVTWDDIDWLKNVTSLPIILKGIMHPLDAILAHEHGVAGIIVSNHGGR
jgi:isopentenyl diphosphate isomerase/L-lactate dehydrogenase-like FMN-dependent dehydrogenase